MNAWVEFYRLGEGRYRLAFEGTAGQYCAAMVPGFGVEVAWFWQPPQVLEALRELEVIP